MLNHTIITTIITVAGTLVGGLIGFLGAVITNTKSNRHATDLENIRIDEEKRKEKSKRDIAIVEETYQTLIKVDGLCVDFVYDVDNSNLRNLDEAVRGLKEIRLTSDRVKTLIRLYLPTLKQDLEEYISNLEKYWNTTASLKFGKKGQQINPNELRREFTEAQEAYKLSLGTLQARLEGLMEKVAL